MSRLVVFLIAISGCYRPQVADRGFRCDATQKYLCPEGFTCDTDEGLCVKIRDHHDLGFPDMVISFDASVLTPDHSCDNRVKAGMLSGLTNLGTVNTAGDESAFALSPNGQNIYYLTGGTLMTAPLTNAKTAGTPQAVSVTGLTAIYGFAFTSDGFLWIAGSDASNSELFKFQVDSVAHITLVDAHLPAGACPITDVAFTDGDITKDLYVAYPLAGCNMPEGRGSYIAQGLMDKQMGAFFAALATPGYRAPFILPGGLSMLFSSTGAGARLYYAERPATDALWTGPLNLPLSKLSVGVRDQAAIVSSDCNTLYLVSERAGGKGGLDLWAADIK